jgi:hypothetical protein
MSSLMQQQLASVEPDEAEVNELYRKMSREFLLTTLKFRNEEDAVALEEQYKSGAAFDELAKRFIEEGRAEGELGGQEYMKLKDFLPTVAQVAFEMEVDSVSEILTADGGFLLFHILDVRFYEDPALKEEARQRILGPVKKQKAREYGDSLERKYATIDEGLLEEADFESRKTGFLGLGAEKPVDFQELLDDDRVVATVHSDPPYSITVGDLARKVKQAYFHGIEKALEQHEKLNERRRIILKNQIFRRTTRMEAASRGLDQTEEYLNAVEEYTNSLLFDTFINKVVLPDVEISEEEVRKYYEEHADDFSSPRMLRVNSLVFYSLTDAESALRKLNERADFKWVSANSPGQVDKDTKGISPFDSQVLSLTSLPKDLRKAAEAAGRGDALLYSGFDDYHHVIVVEQAFPAERKPYEAAREPIAKILFGQKVRDLVDHWSEQLQEAYEARIFVTGLGD